MNKNGFISTTLIYAFFIIFLTLMVFLLNSYAHNRNLLNSYKQDIKQSFIKENKDVILYYMIWNNELSKYEINNNKPDLGYIYNNSLSNCTNGSIINYLDNNITIENKLSDVCFIYFDTDNKELNYAKDE